jgi:transcriptional regulator with XRE-family HTH domain
MTIGDRIRIRRNELKLSQRELCQKMGYSNHSTIGKIETGKVDIPQSRIVQFAEVLGVSVAYLMGWDEEIKKDPKATAERHFEILMDEDFIGMFNEFQSLDKQKRKIVKDLVRSLAETEA